MKRIGHQATRAVQTSARFQIEGARIERCVYAPATDGLLPKQTYVGFEELRASTAPHGSSSWPGMSPWQG